jgi:fumarate hydratase class I
VGIICENTDMAKAQKVPICQDTGMPTFWIRCPRDANHDEITRDVHEAVATATRMGILRPNSVDPITGRNAGLNLGHGTPILHFEQSTDEALDVTLLLKGGGCENQSAQYSLPCELPGVGQADRDLEGVHKCILHAVYQAQGHGCSPGFVGVCIGSDRAEGYAEAKRQLLRPIDAANPVPELAALEERVVTSANRLGIGTMGLGGAVTLMSCKAAALNRVPASFFVTVAYNCWAYRRLGARLDPRTGAIVGWRGRSSSPPDLAVKPLRLVGDSIRRLTTPLTDEVVRSLKVGDFVIITGAMHTGRDGLHKYLTTHEAPVSLEGGIIYHCGPVVVKDESGHWQVKSAGPTTSIREEPYQAAVLQRTGARAVVGKGGMGSRTLEALRDLGAVYLNAIGGAAAYYARTVEAVEGVALLEELGVPEAMWHLRVKEFPAVVTMDSHGNSLHAEVAAASLARLGEVMPNS